MAEKKKQEEKLEDALLKVALGYQLAEVTEEYAEVNGELKLTKRKKTKKDIPPDLKAVQLLLSSDGGAEYAGFSDEELEEEKGRLLAALKEKEKGNAKVKEGGKVAAKKKKSASKTKKTVKKSKSSIRVSG